MEDRVGADFSYRIPLMGFQVDKMFGDSVPDTLEDFDLASQIFQSDGFKYMIEMFRANKGERSGIIWWNLLDGWPQMSDAVVDYYFAKKLAYHYIKISQAPFTIAADEPKDGTLSIYACNDTLSPARGSLAIKDAIRGDIICTCNFESLANASTRIAELKYEEIAEKILIFEWEAGKQTGRNHYSCLSLPVSMEVYKKFLKKYFDNLCP